MQLLFLKHTCRAHGYPVNPAATPYCIFRTPPSENILFPFSFFFFFFFLIRNICRGGSATKVNNYSFFSQWLKISRKNCHPLLLMRLPMEDSALKSQQITILKNAIIKRNKNLFPKWKCCAMSQGVSEAWSWYQIEWGPPHNRPSRAFSFSQQFH